MKNIGFILLLSVFIGCGLLSEENIPELENTKFHSINDIPRYTNKDYLNINGAIVGDYVKAILEIDDLKIESEIKDSIYFYFEVEPFKNKENIINIYALDRYNRSSDTLSKVIIHDNISPKIVEHSVNSISQNVKAPISILFDSELMDYSAKLTSRNVADATLSPMLDNAQKGLIIEEDKLFFGRDYKLLVQVSDSAGNIQSDEIDFKTYLKKITITEDDIIDFEISTSRESLLLLTRNPNGIVEIDLKSLTIKQTIPIDDLVMKMAQNPYNNYLYVTSDREQKILVFNLDSGDIVEKITPVIDRNRLTRFWEIDFTADGKGFYRVYENQFQILATNNNNEIEVHDSGHSPYPISFNNKKDLLMLEQSRSIENKFYNTETDSFDKDFDQVLTKNFANHLTADKLLFCADNKFIFITNKKLNNSQWNCDSGQSIFDFTYLQNYENQIYHINSFEKYFYIIDVKTGVKTEEYGTRGFHSGGRLKVDPITKNLIFIGDQQILIVEPKTLLEIE